MILKNINIYKFKNNKYIKSNQFEFITPNDLIKGSYLIVYEKDDKKFGFAGEGIYDAIKPQKPTIKPTIAFITRLYNKMVDTPRLEDQNFFKEVLNVFGEVTIIKSHYVQNLDWYLDKNILELINLNVDNSKRLE